MPGRKTSAAVDVAFVPAVTFFGYPDDVHRVDYYEGVPSSAPAAYVALLREKGLVADTVPTDAASAAATTEAVAPI